MADAARVLVVDDSPTIRRVVGSVLQRAGYEVATADGGVVGVREVEVFGPDIVLLDLVMPTVSGMQTLDLLDDTFGDEGPPVILMCTRTDQIPVVDEHLHALGVVDTITKPFSPEALLAVIGHSLEKHGRRRRSADATRVVMALASIAAADVDDKDVSKPGVPMPRGTFGAPANITSKLTSTANAAPVVKVQQAPVRDMLHDPFFGDDEQTMPGLRAPVMTTATATVIQSTGFGAAVGVQALHLPQTFALVGDLSVIGLPEVLQLLKYQRQVGQLVVDAGGLRFEVGIDEGNIVAVTARDADGGPARRGELLLGRYLVAAGHVEQQVLDAQLSSSVLDSRPIGERLVAAGAVTRQALSQAIAEQAQDLMVELLRARRGTFGLRAGNAALPLHLERPGWSVDMLLFEGLRRIDEWGVIENEVPSFEARFALRGPLDDSGLSAEEATLLRMFSTGPMRVRDLVRRLPHQLPFDVCRVLYRLSVLKRVQRIDDGDQSRLVNDARDPMESQSLPPRGVTS
ncbi:MAG TPA: response regulator [Myxococcota bacterium]